MSYATPKYISYTFATAVTDTAWAIAKPAGATSCRVVDIQASVTTTYNAVTTAALIKVGVASNVAVAGYISLGTTAAGSAVGLGTQFTKGVNPLIPVLDLTATANPASTTTAVEALECLGPVLVTFTANTGGTPAGAAVATVTLAWF